MAQKYPLYFNEVYETMPEAKLMAIETAKFLRQMRYVYENGPFYRRKFEERGIRPENLDSIEDIVKLPYTEKDELRRSQLDNPPFGDYFCTTTDKLIRIHATSGTSGTPLLVPFTRHDTLMQNEVGARAIWAMGGRPGDICLECASYTLFVGGVSDHMCAENAGVAVIPVGFGNSKLLLEVQQKTKANVIGTIPSYMDHLAQVVREQLCIEPSQLGLTKGVFGGEPGNLRKIEEEWGIDARDCYGLSEVACNFGGDCDYKEGIHFLGQGHIYAELIDPDSGSPVEIKAGSVGEVVFTNLDREACPMVRFRTHDMIRVVDTSCKCGRTGFRFQFLGRSDDMLIVRGVNVFPLAIRDVVSGFVAKGVTGNIKVVLDKPGIQISSALKVKVEAKPGLPDERISTLKREIEQLLHDKLRFRADVLLVPTEQFGSQVGATGKISFVEKNY